MRQDGTLSVRPVWDAGGADGAHTLWSDTMAIVKRGHTMFAQECEEIRAEALAIAQATQNVATATIARDAVSNAVLAKQYYDTVDDSDTGEIGGHRDMSRHHLTVAKTYLAAAKISRDVNG